MEPEIETTAEHRLHTFPRSVFGLRFATEPIAWSLNVLEHFESSGASVCKLTITTESTFEDLRTRLANSWCDAIGGLISRATKINNTHNTHTHDRGLSDFAEQATPWRM
jgi:hypothetical protein